MENPTCSQIAAALDVRVTKATQAWQPALCKVAAMLRLYPNETIAAIAKEMADQAEQEERSKALAPRQPVTAKMLTESAVIRIIRNERDSAA